MPHLTNKEIVTTPFGSPESRKENAIGGFLSALTQIEISGLAICCILITTHLRGWKLYIELYF